MQVFNKKIKKETELCVSLYVEVCMGYLVRRTPSTCLGTPPAGEGVGTPPSTGKRLYILGLEGRETICDDEWS